MNNLLQERQIQQIPVIFENEITLVELTSSLTEEQVSIVLEETLLLTTFPEIELSEEDLLEVAGG
jgi:hypothetical protein